MQEKKNIPNLRLSAVAGCDKLLLLLTFLLLFLLLLLHLPLQTKEMACRDARLINKRLELISLFTLTSQSMSAVQLHVTLAATTEEDKIIELHTANKKGLSLHRLMWFELQRVTNV